MKTVYLDNAATSFPKPSSVTDEVYRCISYYCGNPGRSSHKLAMASAEKIYDCRERLSSFFSAPSPERVIFTQNATYALNMAIKGILRRGDHVLISDMEHNAVLRPISAFARSGLIKYDTFRTHNEYGVLPDDEICADIMKKIKPTTAMLICSHVPNICSSVLPIKKIGSLCKRQNILFLLDASQSAGHIPISMTDSGIDIICAPGHKGLLGIQGCGFMILGDGIEADTLIEGGSGVDSLNPAMPEEAPERFEAGTLPTPAIVGLSEGIKYLSSFSPHEIHIRECELFEALRDRLEGSPELSARIYVPESSGSVLLFNLMGHSPDEVGRFLSKRNICVRSGYHCAPLGHKTLGTPKGGAVRVSFGLFNRKSELDILTKALKDFVRQ